MSTLVEELESAAQLAEGAGRKTGTLDSITEGNHFAKRLRQRAAWVRELERDFRTPATDWAKGYKRALLALAGPTPAAETAPTEREPT